MKSSIDRGPDGEPLRRMGGFPIQFVEMSEQLGRYDKVAAAADQIAARFPAQAYGRVLDVCSGMGHWAGAMSRRGYQVIGLDASVQQVEAARDRFPSASFMVGDMSRPPPGPFDLVLNTYSSFGYGLSRQEDLETLTAWQRVLRPEGCLVMEVVDIERVKFVFGDSTRVVRGDGCRVPREDLCMDWHQQLLFVEYKMNSWIWSGFTRFYTAEQLHDMLRQAGFGRVTFSGAFDGVAPKRPEDWAVATCWK